MKALAAPAKINLALVVGPLRRNGKHEVATVMQRLALADRVTVSVGERLAVSGFEEDTIVRQALGELAAHCGVEPAWSVEIEKAIPVAAGLGGGSSDAASALLLANELLPAPLDHDELADIAATIGADVPFFLRRGPQLGSGDGSVVEGLELPQNYSVLLVLPTGVAKGSTAEVYRAFAARNGPAGFDERKTRLLGALASIQGPADLARLPANDLAASPLAQRLLETGAFRADVSGAGPCVYGLFDDRAHAEAAARALRTAGRTWVTSPFEAP